MTLTEERGGVSSSSLSFKGTCTETGRREHSCFWQGKKGVVLHYHWEILNKVCYRLFMKTLKNHTNLCKWASDVPFKKILANTAMFMLCCADQAWVFLKRWSVPFFSLFVWTSQPQTGLINQSVCSTNRSGRHVLRKLLWKHYFCNTTCFH